jgi:hypothetical protein
MTQGPVKKELPDHVISVVEEEVREDRSDGLVVPGTSAFRARCSCGWRSYVAFTDSEGAALDQGRKHADRVYRRPYPRSVTLNLRIEAGQQSADELKEIVRIAKSEAMKE